MPLYSIVERDNKAVFNRWHFFLNLPIKQSFF